MSLTGCQGFLIYRYMLSIRFLKINTPRKANYYSIGYRRMYKVPYRISWSFRSDILSNRILCYI